MKEARYYAASCDIITIPTQVNDILINMVNNAADNNAIRATKKLIKTAKVETIFLDSSGYSLLCNEEKATNDPNIKKTVSFNKYKPVIYKNGNYSGYQTGTGIANQFR